MVGLHRGEPARHSRHPGDVDPVRARLARVESEVGVAGAVLEHVVDAGRTGVAGGARLGEHRAHVAARTARVPIRRMDDPARLRRVRVRLELPRADVGVGIEDLLPALHLAGAPRRLARRDRRRRLLALYDDVLAGHGVAVDRCLAARRFRNRVPVHRPRFRPALRTARAHHRFGGDEVDRDLLEVPLVEEYRLLALRRLLTERFGVSTSPTSAAPARPTARPSRSSRTGSPARARWGHGRESPRGTPSLCAGPW